MNGRLACLLTSACGVFAIMFIYDSKTETIQYFTHYLVSMMSFLAYWVITAIEDK